MSLMTLNKQKRGDAFADGDEGKKPGSCPNRAESLPMNTTTTSLILMNYFSTNPNRTGVCSDNSAPLISMMNTCQQAAGKRWPNFIAVDFYQVQRGYIIFLGTSLCLSRVGLGQWELSFFYI